MQELEGCTFRPQINRNRAGLGAQLPLHQRLADIRRRKRQTSSPVTSELDLIRYAHRHCAIDFKQGLHGWAWPELKMLACCMKLVQLVRTL